MKLHFSIKRDGKDIGKERLTTLQDAVSELMDLTEDIRRSRRRRAHRRADELEVDIEIDHDHYHAHRPQRPVPRRRRRSSGYLDERFRELEVSVDERRPRGGYYYY